MAAKVRRSPTRFRVGERVQLCTNRPSTEGKTGTIAKTQTRPEWAILVLLDSGDYQWVINREARRIWDRET